MSKEIVLGKIIKPHGIKGAVKIKSFAESPESFIRIKQIFVDNQDGNPTRSTFNVENAGGMGGKVILKLKELNTREDAEALIGSVITTTRDNLPETNEGEYYWSDLIGLEVYDASGKHFGTIKNVLPTGSNDVYVVEGLPDKCEERDKSKKGNINKQSKNKQEKNNLGEILIPGTHDAVLKIDLSENKMIIDTNFVPSLKVEN